MELNNNEDKATPRTMLGRRLRRMREDTDLSIRALAEKVGYPYSYLGRVERGEQLPSEALVSALDAHFGTSGLFADLWEMTHNEVIADYSRKVVSREPDAERIEVFNSSVVPGLLQTPDYARELFRTGLPGTNDDELTERVAVRMHRQHIFEREEAPFYWAIMDEAALKRPVGGQECMRGQLGRVLQAVGHPRVTVQVLPFAEGAHSILGGGLTLLTLKSGGTIGLVESFDSGEVVESPKRLARLSQSFAVVTSKALPEDKSINLIRQYLKDYENEHDC
ncbi:MULTISPECIES: helix-turn-helix domain-containing protein [Streptomyces violaceusniger group]|uniref:Helix-turn-helix transcriptional regulator n=1 Tax=Streptomyces antimycoticus TaxID=68175 RepID=A0ABD5JA51_9ACTN|nr:helix-turn-helix transcriptional regulator [Streptomyces violaceusniger]MEE4585262.1 helix-turn-helix transcriptional regulator [Streptomyces sp. DSM 41602]